MTILSGRPAGFLPAIATAGSIIACYGTLAAVSLLSAAGIGIAVNNAAWAGAISFFALLAAAAIAWKGTRRGRYGPAILAVAGAAVIVWTMFVDYQTVMETGGFAMLVAATAWDWAGTHRRG